MTDRKRGLGLTGPLGLWQVHLKDGSVLEVHAHGVVEQENHYAFVALMRGSPNYEIAVCRIPMTVVRDFFGG